MTFKPGVSGNLKGRPRKKMPTALAARSSSAMVGPRSSFRRDGYVNVASGLGTPGDRRTAARFETVYLNEMETRGRYRGGDMEARIIEAKVNEAFRRGYEIKIPEEFGGKGLAEEIMSYAEELEVDEKCVNAAHYENAYGGGAIIPATEDLGELSQPLDEGGIVSLDAFHVLEPRELQPESYYTDLRSPKFREPETWRLVPLVTNGYSAFSQEAVIVHESRVITLPGIRVSSQTLSGQRPGWGDSVLMRCDEVLRDFGQSWGSAAHLLTDFAKGVLKLSGLDKMMQSADGEAILAKRIEAMDAFSSTIRSLVISGNDDFQRTASSVSGLDTMLIQFAQRLAAAADMPVTVLMGMSPAGMNATGEGDRISWYDRVAAYQKRMRRYVERMLRFIMLSNDGPTEGVEPDVWSIEWRPLYAPSAKEDADTKLAIAQSDQIWYNIGSVSSDDITNSHWGGDTFSASLQIDFAAREAQKKAEEQAAADAQAHELEMTKVANPPTPPNDPNADPNNIPGTKATVEQPPADTMSAKASQVGGSTGGRSDEWSDAAREAAAESRRKNGSGGSESEHKRLAGHLKEYGAGAHFVVLGTGSDGEDKPLRKASHDEILEYNHTGSVGAKHLDHAIGVRFHDKHGNDVAVHLTSHEVHSVLHGKHVPAPRIAHKDEDAMAIDPDDPAPGHQETSYSCGAAALGYALSAIGVKVDEAKIVELSDTTEDGADETQLAAALDELGVGHSEDRDASFAGLLGHLKDGNTCLLCVDDWEHWVAIVGVLGKRVVFRDPTNTDENIEANTVHLLGEEELALRWKGPDDKFYLLVVQS